MNQAQYDVELKIQATTAEAQKAIAEVDKSLKQFVRNVTGSEAVLQDFAEVEQEAAEETKKFTVTLEDVTKALDSTSKVAKDIGKSFQDLGKSLRSTGSTLSKSVTAPLLAFGGLAVKSFSDQQESLLKLNQSLRNNGSFTQQASAEMQKFASALQSSSAFSADLITSQLALARNFTNTNQEAQALVKAAADLSAATGVDLETSVKNLGKSLSGVAGPLDELVPSIRSFSREQLIAGAAIDEVSKKFAGSALATTKTFSGQVTQLRNSFGDFLTLIGAELTPIFSNLVARLRSAVDFLNGLDASTRRTIIVIAGFAAAIGPVLIGLGVLSSSIGAGVRALGVLVTGFKSLLVLLSGPVGIAIAIGALVASVAGLVNLFLELKKVTNDSAESFLLAWRFATSAFESFVIKPILIGLQKVYDVLGRIPGFAGQVFRDSSNFLGGLIEGIEANATSIDEDIKRVFAGTGQTAGNAFTFGLSGAISDGLSTIKESFNELVAKPLAETTTENVNKVSTDTKKLSEDSRRVLSSIGTTAVSSFSSAFSSISDGTKSAGDAFKDFARSAIDSIQRIVLEAALLRALSSAFPSVFGTPSAGSTSVNVPATAKTGGFVSGGNITRRFASGGPVSGPGNGTSDSILARLSNGEFVSDAKTVSHFGVDFFSNLKRMARGFSGAPSYSAGLPAFANGGLVSGQGGETRVVIENSGSPKETRDVSVEQDARGTVISIILDDISRNGNISKTFQNSFGLKRSGV